MVWRSPGPLVDVCHLYAGRSWLTGRNERLRLASRAHDCHYGALLRGETHGDQGRTENARDRHPDCQHSMSAAVTITTFGSCPDVCARVAPPSLPLARCLRSYGAPRYYSFLVDGARLFALGETQMIRIRDTKLLGDPLNSCRRGSVGGR